MAYYGRNSDRYTAGRIVTITGTEQVDNYTVYVIQVGISQHKWTVRHRYSEFFELHEKLVNQFKVDKTLLPPKKIFGNQSEAFIKKRQQELEVYLRTILQHFSTVPDVLAEFLLFHKYEIHGITETLAEQLYHRGDLILQAKETFHASPLQLSAISTRLKLPEPTCDSSNPKKDLGHILDFVTRLKSLRVVGSKAPYGKSNIQQNSLDFELSCFKSLESLELDSCNPAKITGAEQLKKTLKKIKVHYSIKAVKEVLLLEVGFGQWVGGEEESVLVPAWSSVTYADFSHNSISIIDESVKLLPKVEYLNLSHNQIQSIQQLQNLSCLTRLDLSNNHIHTLQTLHTRLGNVKSLTLTGNKIDSLQGFCKLYSLESLDVTNNDISQVSEVRHISGLPCLEHLHLTGNPVTIVLDYRTKVLELFGARASEVTLDSQKSTQKELDTVAILLAIQKSKEAKDKNKRRPAKKAARDVTIGDSSSSHSNRDNNASQSDPPTQPTPSGWELGAALQELSQTDAELYRQQVEQIRQQGGEGWLTLLNHLQNHPTTSVTAATADAATAIITTTSTSAIATTTAIATSKFPPPPPPPHSQTSPYHATTHQQRYSRDEQTKAQLELGVKPLVPSDSGSDLAEVKDADALQSGVTIPQALPPRQGDFMLPETLPTRNDSTFVMYTQALIPDTQALTQKCGLGPDHQREERPIHLMWCSVVCYTNPFREIPVCVLITTECVHFFRVMVLKGDIGFPELDHIYCIPLMNIQQIVLGYQNLYIRIEEAFLGPQGTYTLLTGNVGKTDLFLDSLKLAYRRAIPDLDQYEDPHVVVNGETELNLKGALNRMEGHDVADNVNIILYMLVFSPDVFSEKKPYVLHSLVLTSRYLYVLREDYILWPQPTFAIGPATTSQFEIVSAFPVSGRITAIQMYDSDTENDNNDHSLPESFSATQTSSMIMPNFVGFGVRLTFDLRGVGTKVLDIRVPVPGMRDRFLANLTNIRKQMFERSPSPSKGKSRKSRCGDPENASIGSNSSSGSRSGKRPKRPATTVALPVGGNEDYHKPATRPSTIEPPSAGDTDILDFLENRNEYLRKKETGAEGDSSHVLPPRESPTGQSDITSDSNGVGRGSVATGPAAAANNPLPSIIKPPSTLDLGYPSVSLLDHLSGCTANLKLMHALSGQMMNIACMMGEEVVNFFHKVIAQISMENEELRHIVWTNVIPYMSPDHEVPTCIMLSTRAVYFVSDEMPAFRPSPAHLKTHSRNKSDSFQYLGGRKASPMHTSGIIHQAANGQKVVRTYTVLKLNELKAVHVGMFDQCFRLSGSDGDKVLTCVTRDNILTETFIKQLMLVLSSIYPSPSPDPKSVDSEPDFYQTFNQYNRQESLEFTHSSKVKFVYPSDDLISDLTYLVVDNIQGKKPDLDEVTMLMYILAFQLDKPYQKDDLDLNKGQPRTLVLTENHIALAIEDLVNYPLPDFVRAVPVLPQVQIQEVRNLELLKRVLVSDLEKSHDLVLVFADEREDISVDASLDYYSSQKGTANPGKDIPEVTWTLVIQSSKDKDRLLKLLSRQWEELHGGKELSIQVHA